MEHSKRWCQAIDFGFILMACFFVLAFFGTLSVSRIPLILVLAAYFYAAGFFGIPLGKHKSEFTWDTPVYVLSILILKQLAIFAYVPGALIRVYYFYKTRKDRTFLGVFGLTAAYSVALVLACRTYQSLGGGDFFTLSAAPLIPFIGMSLVLFLFFNVYDAIWFYLLEGRFALLFLLSPVTLIEYLLIPVSIPIYLLYRHDGVGSLALLLPVYIAVSWIIKVLFQSLNERNETLERLNIAGELIQGRLSFKELTKRVIEKVQAALNCHSVELFTIADDGLVLQASTGIVEHNRQKDVERDSTLFELKSEKPLIFQDISGDSRFRFYGQQNFFSLLLIPLTASGQHFGWVICGHQTAGFFDYVHLETAKVLQPQLSAGVEAAKLHEELSETLKRLQETQAQLVQSEKMAGLGKLVAGVAHELNNPLNFISMQLPLIKEKVTHLEEVIETYGAYELSLPEEDRVLLVGLKKNFGIEEMPSFFSKAFSALGEGTNRCKRIIDNLRTFARTETVGESWDFVDINEAIDSTLILLTDRYENRVTLHKEYGNIPKVWCNAPQINQVFMNLLNNAFDAIPGTGDVWIKTEVTDGHCKISIRDSGQGIPEDIKARIFDPFFTTKEVGKGTGLGLSIVYSIIQQHKGQITVESKPGAGSMFTVILPVKTA